MTNRTIKFILLSPLFIAGIAALAALFGWIVMSLWNGVLVPVLGVKIITFWQALGILVLSRILVGGFGSGSKRSDSGWYWKKKWMRMTPEEKTQFREKWRQRFGDEFFNEQRESTQPESQQ